MRRRLISASHLPIGCEGLAHGFAGRVVVDADRHSPARPMVGHDRVRHLRECRSLAVNPGPRPRKSGAPPLGPSAIAVVGATRAPRPRPKVASGLILPAGNHLNRCAPPAEITLDGIRPLVLTCIPCSWAQARTASDCPPGCSVDYDAGSGSLPRSAGPVGGRRTSSGLRARGSLDRRLRNHRLGGRVGCRAPLGSRLLGSLDRRLPRPRVSPTDCRNRPVVRFRRHCAGGARVGRYGYRGRLLRLARQAVPPVGTTQDAQGILVTVFTCINGDARKTHSQPSTPRLRSSHYANAIAVSG